MRTGSDKAGEILIWILAAVSVVFILLGVLISYYLILRYRYGKKFEESDYSTKMYLIFIRILILLKYEGFTLGKQETLLMLSDKIKDRYRFKDINFCDVVDIYMAYRYGEIHITKKEFDIVDIFYKGLNEHYKSKHNKLKRHLEEFLFLVKRNNLNIIN